MFIKHEIRLPDGLPEFFYHGFAKLEALDEKCESNDAYEFIGNSKRYDAYYFGFMAAVKRACYVDGLITEDVLWEIRQKYASVKPIKRKK